MDSRTIELNGIRYQRPSQPVAVVCIDGGDPTYFEQGLKDGIRARRGWRAAQSRPV